MDFAKTLGSVDYNIHLHKLKVRGVSEHLHHWFESYLSDCCQRVAIDGIMFSGAPVTSGVQQGSILGPVLFALFINDLFDILQDDTSTALEADDAKAYSLNQKLTEKFYIRS